MWERGFDIFKTSKSGNRVKKTVPELRKILLGCEDFKNEVGALEQIVIERGHLLIMSPKGHPELAGVGIEYGWGHAKYLFRKNNTMVVKEKANVDLHRRVLDALGAVDLENTRRFARRTRSHRRAYCKKHSNDPNITKEEKDKAHAAVERFVKKVKTHRCILEQDWSFVVKAAANGKVARRRRGEVSEGQPQPEGQPEGGERPSTPPC